MQKKTFAICVVLPCSKEEARQSFGLKLDCFQLKAEKNWKGIFTSSSSSGLQRISFKPEEGEEEYIQLQGGKVINPISF